MAHNQLVVLHRLQQSLEAQEAQFTLGLAGEFGACNALAVSWKFHLSDVGLCPLRCATWTCVVMVEVASRHISVRNYTRLNEETTRS